MHKASIVTIHDTVLNRINFTLTFFFFILFRWAYYFLYSIVVQWCAYAHNEFIIQHFLKQEIKVNSVTYRSIIT